MPKAALAQPPQAAACNERAHAMLALFAASGWTKPCSRKNGNGGNRRRRCSRIDVITWCSYAAVLVEGKAGRHRQGGRCTWAQPCTPAETLHRYLAGRVYRGLRTVSLLVTVDMRDRRDRTFSRCRSGARGATDQQLPDLRLNRRGTSASEGSSRPLSIHLPARRIGSSVRVRNTTPAERIAYRV